MPVFCLNILFCMLTILAALCSSSAQYNQMPGSTQFLAGVRENLSLRHKQALADRALSQKYKVPFVRDLDFQAGNRDISALENLFAIRFNTNNLSEFSKYGNFSSLQNKLLLAQARMELSEMLEERYELCLAYERQRREIFWMDSIFKLQKQRLAILLELVSAGQKVNVKDLSGLVDDKNEAQAKLSQARLELQNLLEKMGVLMNGKTPDTLLTGDWIGMEELGRRLKEGLVPEEHALEFESRMWEAEYKTSEYKLARSRAREWNASLQFGIRDYDNRLSFSEKFFSRLGLTIPLGGQPDRRLPVLELEKMEAEQKAVLADSMRAWMMRASKNTLERELAEFVAFDRSEETGIFGKILNSPVLLQSMSPDEILETRIRDLKMKRLRDEREMNVLDAYIRWLQGAEQLASEPLKNHLTLSLVPLD